MQSTLPTLTIRSQHFFLARYAEKCLACSRISVSEDDRKCERATSGISGEWDPGEKLSDLSFFPNRLRNVLPKFIEIYMETLGVQKPTEISVTEFCYKSVNLSLEELKKIKIILFLIHELFR